MSLYDGRQPYLKCLFQRIRVLHILDLQYLFFIRTSKIQLRLRMFLSFEI